MIYYTKYQVTANLKKSPLLINTWLFNYSHPGWRGHYEAYTLSYSIQFHLRLTLWHKRQIGGKWGVINQLVISRDTLRLACVIRYTCRKTRPHSTIYYPATVTLLLFHCSIKPGRYTVLQLILGKNGCRMP